MPSLLPTLLLALASIVPSTISNPLPASDNTNAIRQEQPPAFAGPVIKSDFPDPSIIKVNGTWYAFGTQSIFDFKDIRVQVASTTEEGGGDFEGHWRVWEGYDALVSRTSTPIVGSKCVTY